MRPLLGSLLRALLYLGSLTAAAAPVATCTGRFPNPITDICWSCILPLSIGSATIGNFGGQEDNANPASPVCSCGVNPTIGLSVGFWEPARHVEVVRRLGIRVVPALVSQEGKRLRIDELVLP